MKGYSYESSATINPALILPVAALLALELKAVGQEDANDLAVLHWPALVLRGRLRSSSAQASDEAEGPCQRFRRGQPFLEARHVDSGEPGPGR